MPTKINLNWGYQPALVLKAVIICDDFEFAASAASTLVRVGRQASVGVQWTTRCWPINELQDLTFAEHALVQALDSHLIVIQAERASMLPAWIFDWLKLWATRRTVQNAALGIIRGGSAAGPTDPTCSVLLSFAQEHGLSLIADQRPPPTDPPRLIVHFPTEQGALIPFKQMGSSTLAPQRCLREFGINE